jgi:DNA (cytosine-5)-methyltransferase 1
MGARVDADRLGRGRRDLHRAAAGRAVSAYYNEIDPYAAAWLRNLIAAGHIAPGEVDTRSIREVQADDVRGFTQAHFFAGIGVWSHALRLAGWADDRPVWTGSCPCQPFSAIGLGGGGADARHLWPEWFRLARECRPSVVLGEQTSGPAGRAWLDLVHADMEACGYAVAAADLPACGIGAPHIRARLWWVAAQGADPDRERLEGLKPAGPAAGPAYRPGARGVARWWETEPGVDRVADGTAGVVGPVRAIGNAIVAPLAAEFIAAVMECRP